MKKDKKTKGQVFTPGNIVALMLDYGGYVGERILDKQIADNSCGDGAFLVEIVKRYIETARAWRSESRIKNALETQIHGVDIEQDCVNQCRENLTDVAEKYGITGVNWDVRRADALTFEDWDGKMDEVFGNPPYVRVHHLGGQYERVKQFEFARQGMTDLYVVFFEVGLRMLKQGGQMCLVTPSSWTQSLAGKDLREYINRERCLNGVIDFGHQQVFEATTYSMISRFRKGVRENDIEYGVLDDAHKLVPCGTLRYEDVAIGGNFYFSQVEDLRTLRGIKMENGNGACVVKNGFATLADSVFIGNFEDGACVIDVLKASNGKWAKCIFPYEKTGKVVGQETLERNERMWKYLNEMREKLPERNQEKWWQFGRTQAIKDVWKDKIAVNTIVKNLGSLRIEYVGKGKGIYSGLYVTQRNEADDFDTWAECVRNALYSEDFIGYVSLLKNYKSGGYYTFSSKDLEQYLNYKLGKEYGQQRIFERDWESL